MRPAGGVADLAHVAGALLGAAAARLFERRPRLFEQPMGTPRWPANSKR